MVTENFNPNDVCVSNGNYFGFPYTTENARLMLFPVPWNVTTSYRGGTNNGPQAILDASYQLDFYDEDIEKAWELGIGTDDSGMEIIEQDAQFRTVAQRVIHALESGKEPVQDEIDLVNEVSEALNQHVEEKADFYLNQNTLFGIVGGDHSVPLGFMRALAKKYPSFGILHFDAHADLREAYEGFIYSHASIMYNALQIKNVGKLVQVGIRDFCENEAWIGKNDKRVKQFSDQHLKEAEFTGLSWDAQCDKIINELPQNVYVSFDIDVFSPDLCPNTGTPVPGGLSYNQAVYLLKKLWKSSRKIIGFDLCEVAPGRDELDANVGARVLYKLSNYTINTNK